MDANQKCIFISYRRDDSAGETGRLYDLLKGQFGTHRVYLDVNAIEPGVDFVQNIIDAVDKCEILITVIGNNWLSNDDESGRRIDDPDDFVRLEIKSALERDIRVIPVLVQGATTPSQDDLPRVLAPLARRQTLSIHHSTFQEDTERLVGVIRNYFGEPEVLTETNKPKHGFWLKSLVITQSSAALCAAPGLIINASVDHFLFTPTIVAIGVIVITAFVILGLGVYLRSRPVLLNSGVLFAFLAIAILLVVFNTTNSTLIGIIMVITIITSNARLLANSR